MDDQTNQVGARRGEAERGREVGTTALGRGGRMSRQRKSAAVLRLLRGEDLETVSRERGVTAATLSGWHDAFLAGGEAALTSRAALWSDAGARQEPRHIAGHRQTLRSGCGVPRVAAGPLGRVSPSLRPGGGASGAAARAARRDVG